MYVLYTYVCMRLEALQNDVCVSTTVSGNVSDMDISGKIKHQSNELQQGMYSFVELKSLSSSKNVRIFREAKNHF